MRPLRFVGLSDDGESVLLESEDGEQFSVPRDQALKDAVRDATPEPETPADPAPARIGAIVTNSAITLSPRDIQTRVRAGASPAKLAEESGTPLERILRFAEPVLQERYRVTDEARRGKARRGGDGALVTFGELVDHRLAAHGVEPTVVLWDAFRREDGGWTVTADFKANDAEHQARFAFALTNRTVSALDEIASDLLAGGQIRALLPPPPPPVHDPEPEITAPVRLTSVPNPAPGLGSDSDADSHADSKPDERPSAEPIPLRPPGGRQRAHTRHVPVSLDDELIAAEPELFDQTAFEDWDEPTYPVADDRSSTRPTASIVFEPSVREPAPAPAPVVAAAPVVAPAEITPDVAPEVVPEVASEAAPAAPEVDHEKEAGAHRRKAGDKPKMPSWDDILLGVRRKD